MAGYILVLSVLILGGVIATVGDRLGYRVGKARLSWFNLRPRHTAVLVTILTGGIISATTLGILFAVNKQLRGVFQLEELETQRQTALAELDQVRQEKAAMESTLLQAQQRQQEAQARLTTINQSLAQAQRRQIQTQARLQAVARQAAQLRQESLALEEAAAGWRQEAGQLRQESADLLRQRDRVQAQIASRDREIQQQEALLAQGEQQITDLETAQQFLTQEVQQLERNYRLLQTGSVALARGQVLGSALLQSSTPGNTRLGINELLRQANQVAQQQIRPGTPNPEEPVIQVTQAEVERLIEELSNGQPYVVRVLAARNYVLGDDRAQVVLDVTPNRVIFAPGEVVAKASTDPTMDVNQLRQRLDLLLAASQFRADRAGLAWEGMPMSAQTYVGFLEQLVQHPQPLTIQAIAPVPVYTVGPLRLQFIAMDTQGYEVFRSASGSPAPSPSPSPDGAGL